MRTIPVQELKRRGISFLDDQLEEGPVHVIKNNSPRYVILSEENYQELIEAEMEAYRKRLKRTLAEVKAGKAVRGTAKQIIKELGIKE